MFYCKNMIYRGNMYAAKYACRGNMYAAKIWLTAVICLPQKYACRSNAVAAAEAEFKSVKPLKHSARFGGDICYNLFFNL